MADLTEYQKDILIRTALSEAGGEGEDGIADVLHVILNRAASKKFPSDPAKVALQDKQFSSWNAGKGGNNPSKWSAGSAAYQKAARVLNQVATGSKPDQTGGALYFHTPSVSPRWAKSVNTNGKIVRNGHVFYPTSDAPAVATKLDTSRPAPTPAKPSAVMTASRNRQNMTPAADIGLTNRTSATPGIKTNNSGINDPAEIVLGKQMTTRLPQTPGRSQIERTPRAVVQPSNRALAGAEQAADRGAGAPARPAVTPRSNGKSASANTASARSEQAAARGPAAKATKPTAKLDEIGDMPAFGDVDMLRNSNIPGPVVAGKQPDRLRPQPPLIDPGAALGARPAVVPGIQSAAMIAARKPRVVAPVPAVRMAVRAPVPAKRSVAVGTRVAVTPRAMTPVQAARAQGMTPSQAYAAANQQAADRARTSAPGYTAPSKGERRYDPGSGEWK